MPELYKHVAATRPRCITDLYYIDQSDCFISIAALETLYLFMYMSRSGY